MESNQLSIAAHLLLWVFPLVLTLAAVANAAWDRLRGNR